MKPLRFREFFLNNIQILLKTKPRVSKETTICKFLTKYSSSYKLHFFEIFFRFLGGCGSSYNLVCLQFFRFYNQLMKFKFLVQILCYVRNNSTFKTKRNLGEFYFTGLENLEKVLWS